MKKTLNGEERAARIELLRARAAIERHNLANSVHELRVSLAPKTLFKEALPAFAGSRPVDWVVSGLGLVRRYPFLLSGASAILGGRRSRLRWVKVAAGLLVGWQLSRHLNRPEDSSAGS